MTLDYIWWWGSSSGALRNVESPLPGSFWSGITVSVEVPFMGQIDLFENYKFEIGILKTMYSGSPYFIYIYIYIYIYIVRLNQPYSFLQKKEKKKLTQEKIQC